MATKGKKGGDGVSRREFLKVGGAVAAGAQIGAVAGAGLSAGKDPSTNNGWQHLGDNTQFVDRKPLEIDEVPYEIVETPVRPVEVESAFGRQRLMMPVLRSTARRTVQQAPDAGEERKEGRGQSASEDREIPPEAEDSARRGPPKMQMPPVDVFKNPLRAYYEKHPHVYELDKVRVESILPKKRQDVEKYGDYYTLINAWSGSWSTHESISGPPEVSDFQLAGYGGRGHPIPDPVPFKSPAHASKLIKKVAHHFGATMVGIAKLNPDWCYNHDLRGSKDRGPYEVPKHWEYVIAIGVPHQWEQVLSNPNCGSSFDAYSRVTIAARRLDTFIKQLGYPARRHSPMDGYDVIGVPILVDAGLGQQGRHGIVITPETGSNFRSAYVTTNLPMEIDKPIDFGVNEFCGDCKICAELCPSNSISYEKSNKDMYTRGYRHWEINQTSCYNYWMQSMGGMGCRLCLIACPYSRRSNWVHQLAREADTHDPTGLLNNTFTWMQKAFFKTPDAPEYLPPPDGRFATFREPPEWLSIKNYLDIKAPDPTKGE